MRRRASFNAASLTRRPSVSPERKRDEIANSLQQHHQQQRTPVGTNDTTTINTSSSPATHATSSSVEKVTPNILTVLSSILTRLIARNEQHFPVLSSVNQNDNKKLSSFQGVRAPGISVSKYLERIHKYTNSSLSCFVVAYIYLDRLIHQQPDQPITSMNVHRLLITSLMIAAKVVDDVHFNNAFYAKVGGISNAELNKLELNFLFCLDFRVQVTAYVFESYCSHMEKELHSVVYVPVQRSLPVFGDSRDAESAEQLVKDGLDHE
ncbi:hypothetical protein GOP47_0007550 [Adiantum capillus-veneris]|uniref:Cyclin n=1 Tax=Adiantum capillus-veneris TaxID=13818 RepID=A0A9D4ZLM5_ADICA|nr:hypothetical protein GOP47_0007550 [Adiantum capillus-veneris]